MIKMITVNEIGNEKNNMLGITHGGVFHADEVLATVILKKYFGDIAVCRTLKVPNNIINKDNIIIYDIGLGKYDHHQKGGNGVRENGVPYASAGLIWKDYGPKILENIPNKDLVWSLVDRDLIQGVDAIDCGFLRGSLIRVLSFSNMISNFNADWDSSDSDDEAFVKAVSFAEIVFDQVLEKAIATARAKDFFEDALNKSKDNILILEHFVPWQEFLFTSSNEKAANILFVVFPSKRGGYNWQCVPAPTPIEIEEPKKKEFKKSVPNSWKGLSGSDIQKASGVKTATFCHPNGFIGGALTLDDTIKMAEIAMKS